MSFFDLDRFYQALNLPDDAPFSINLQAYAQLASTNDQLQTLMNNGAPAGTAVIAIQQSQGRGSQGKEWRSPPGGLYLSLGVRPNLPATEGARLTLGSAWGVATTINQQLGLATATSIQLKWPNDLLLQGKKLGGILTESRLRSGSIHQAVIGIGLNWQNPVSPPGICLNSIRLVERNRRIESLEVLTALILQGLVLGYCNWCQGSLPIAPLIAKYESLLSGMGQPIVIPNGQMGNLEGITPYGELKVFVNNGTLLFTPGTINLGYD